MFYMFALPMLDRTNILFNHKMHLKYVKISIGGNIFKVFKFPTATPNPHFVCNCVRSRHTEGSNGYLPEHKEIRAFKIY